MLFQVEVECPECGSHDLVEAVQVTKLAAESVMICAQCDEQWVLGLHSISIEARKACQKYAEHVQTSPTGTILVDGTWMRIFCKALVGQ